MNTNGLLDKLKNAPEWAKNAVAIGAVLLTILGVRLDVNNLRTAQDALEAQQDRVATRLTETTDAVEDLTDVVVETDRKATNLRSFVGDIQKDLDRILEAIRKNRR